VFIDKHQHHLKRLKEVSLCFHVVFISEPFV